MTDKTNRNTKAEIRKDRDFAKEIRALIEAHIDSPDYEKITQALEMLRHWEDELSEMLE